MTTSAVGARSAEGGARMISVGSACRYNKIRDAASRLRLNQPTPGVINGVQRYSVTYSVAPDTDTAGDTALHPIQREMPCRLNSTAARPHSSFVLNTQKDAPVKPLLLLLLLLLWVSRFVVVGEALKFAHSWARKPT
jgi:hypothetical protein